MESLTTDRMIDAETGVRFSTALAKLNYQTTRGVPSPGAWVLEISGPQTRHKTLDSYDSVTTPHSLLLPFSLEVKCPVRESSRLSVCQGVVRSADYGSGTL